MTPSRTLHSSGYRNFNFAAQPYKTVEKDSKTTYQASDTQPLTSSPLRPIVVSVVSQNAYSVTLNTIRTCYTFHNVSKVFITVTVTVTEFVPNKQSSEQLLIFFIYCHFH